MCIKCLMTQVQEHRRTAEGNEQGGERAVPSPSNPRFLTTTIRPNFDPKMARLRCGMLDRVASVLCLAAWFGPAARADTALLREATGLAGMAMWLDSGAPGMVLVVIRIADTW